MGNRQGMGAVTEKSVHIAMNVINVRSGEIYYVGDGTTNMWVEEKALANRYTEEEALTLICQMWNRNERLHAQHYTVETED
jgi:stage V sporulation protein SpoVS